MTTEEVIARVQKIRECAGDYEVAHSREDKLHVAVLEAIAAGPFGHASALAEAALQSREIEFARCCA